MKYRTASLFTAASLAMAWSGAALAADPVTDAMQKTYAPYRVALFKTNNTAAASLSVALNLDKIKGIFGSSNAILLVLENDQKGLDVVEMR